MQGSLAQLDSRNPVMYIDFPEGRMKFFGTLMFPANKYMVLKFGAKGIICEDILESMVLNLSFTRPDACRTCVSPCLLQTCNECV